ncbi:MAG: 4Fe-4S binding protein, partial [Pirellulales bacterium]|nr:4Fe-4S binding protein [Pirellulales bacterium]
MIARSIAAALWLLSLGWCFVMASGKWSPISATSPWYGLAFALAAVVWFASLMAFVSTFDHRSRTLIRLDWFLPQLRRLPPGQGSAGRLAGRWLRRCLPVRWLSDHQTKRRGMLRRWLRKGGISWLASPPRRVVQALSLMLFLALFFYVCWPYDARPASPGQSAKDFQFQEMDQQSGLLKFRGESIPPWIGETGSRVFVGDGETVCEPLEIAAIGTGQISLLASEQVSDEFFDAILTGREQWTLYQQHPDAWPSHYADALSAKQPLPAEVFLAIDPLVSLSTAIASRSWVWSLVCAGIILIVCLLIPRGFCGYLCPLGTTIDLFDWAIASRTKRWNVAEDGWWVHIKYYLLAGTLVAALGGVLVSGFFAAIPVITRGLLFLGEPLQSGALRGWHLVPAMNLGHLVSIVMFLAVLGLGFLRPRFWCKYVCPSGAVFSLGNLFRATERKVESSCIHCNKCVEICPFDAIKPDFTTRVTDCTLCQTCGGVCPTQAI